MAKVTGTQSNETTSQRSPKASDAEKRAIDPETELQLDPALTSAGGIASQADALRRMPPAQGRSLAARVGHVQGNRVLQRVITVMREDGPEAAPTEAAPTEAVTAEEAVELEAGEQATPANPGGRGPGRIQHAGESPYTVTGATLDDITGQLTAIDGFAAQTSAPLGLAGNVVPEQQEDGTYRVEVQWVINGATVTLPRWANYDTACTAAQQEWDRFMGQVRRHEQEAHVDEARTFVSELTGEDTVITGATREELVSNLQAKQQELAGRLQEIHDGCDHGVSIDAILHPDNGRCPTEEETPE